MKTTFWISLLGLMLSGAGRATENPKEPVNLDRVKVDPVYWKAVQHHRVIKSYLAASAQKRPEFEALFLFLLLNGYSIDDLPNAWFVLNRPLFPAPVEADTVRAKGTSDSLIQRQQQQRDLAMSGQRERMVMAATGVHDQVFIEAIMSLVPLSSTMIEDMPLLEAVNNEPMLTDSDWMTGAHRQMMMAYKGQPKTMFQKTPRPSEQPTAIEPKLVPVVN